MANNRMVWLDPFLAHSVQGWERWVLPAVMAAISACGTTLLPVVFNGTTRWGYIFIGLAYLVMHSRKIKFVFSLKLGLLLFLYVFWCFLTFVWSEIPLLSFYKGCTTFMVIFTLFSLGVSWGRSVAIDEAMKFMGLMFLIVLMVTSFASASESFMAGGVDMYVGLAGNPNNMGMLLAIALPFALWNVYTAKSARVRYLWLSLFAYILYHLVISHSRAAMLLGGFELLGFLYGTGIKKYLLHISIVAISAISILLIYPEAADTFYNQYVLKGNVGDQASEAFERSRGAAYEEGYAMALEGGLIGAGNGISIGSNPGSYQGGFTTSGYSREKGNSAMAIVEETGLIGLVIVLQFALVVIISAMASCRSFPQNSLPRVALSTLTGFFIGMLVYSNFEAWWVAQGSAESVVFWGATGVLYGLILQSKSVRHSCQFRKMDRRHFTGTARL